ncbi:LGFP repeat-containing protein [Prauserella marina]|nr:LGFP repeat-containing protein [Prauserella marina]
MHGSTYPRYLTLGGHARGSPITGETKTPDGVGRFNHFADTPGTLVASVYEDDAKVVACPRGCVQCDAVRQTPRCSLVGEVEYRFDAFVQAGGVVVDLGEEGAGEVAWCVAVVGSVADAAGIAEHDVLWWLFVVEVQA